MKVLLSLTVIFTMSIACAAQKITTFAGNGIAGYLGDGAAAASAELYLPSSVAVDGNGNVYIADEDNNCIRKVTKSGIISTIAGNGKDRYGGDGGAATAAELNHPEGVAVDGNGNIYIADTHNDLIRKVDANGTITTFAGNHAPGYGGDGGPATNAMLNKPVGIAIDAQGNLYIADQDNNVVRKVGSSCIITTIAGYNKAGNSGDGGMATLAELNHPAGVAIDSVGNVFIADSYNYRVRKVNTTGTITAFAGGGSSGGGSAEQGGATAPKLNLPWGLAVDRGGNLFIADEFNNYICRVDRDGTMCIIAGNGAGGYTDDGHAATAAELFYPRGVAVDRNGKVYVADAGNNRVRRVTYKPPEVTKSPGQEGAFKVTPDPDKGLLHIRASFPIRSAVVYDPAGKKVCHAEGTTNEMDINIERLPVGVYLLELNSKWVQRFVKE